MSWSPRPYTQKSVLKAFINFEYKIGWNTWCLEKLFLLSLMSENR